eukprot:4066446-Prymnesium_polylepis.1
MLLSASLYTFLGSADGLDVLFVMKTDIAVLGPGCNTPLMAPTRPAGGPSNSEARHRTRETIKTRCRPTAY